MDDLGTRIRNGIRAKKIDMDEAARLLDMSKSGLYNKLNAREIPSEFVQLVEERLGINVNNPERSSATVAVMDRVVGNVTMRYQTVPLKNQRIIEMWLPSDFSKADVASVKQWLAYYESTL